jgi:hypothetical protein
MEGETISPASTIDEIQKMIQWIDTLPTTAEMDELMDFKIINW